MIVTINAKLWIRKFQFKTFLESFHDICINIFLKNVLEHEVSQIERIRSKPGNSDLQVSIVWWSFLHFRYFFKQVGQIFVKCIVSEISKNFNISLCSKNISNYVPEIDSFIYFTFFGWNFVFWIQFWPRHNFFNATTLKLFWRDFLQKHKIVRMKWTNKYGVYSIIKQKPFERGISSALICINFQL